MTQQTRIQLIHQLEDIRLSRPDLKWTDSLWTRTEILIGIMVLTQAVVVISKATAQSSNVVWFGTLLIFFAFLLIGHAVRTLWNKTLNKKFQLLIEAVLQATGTQ